MRTRKLYPARFITQLALCHPICVMICPVRLVTRLELKCNSFYISIRVATSNYSKNFSIIRDELQSLENCFHTFGPPTASYKSGKIFFFETILSCFEPFRPRTMVTNLRAIRFKGSYGSVHSESNILTQDHELVLENLSSTINYTLSNTIIYLK